LEIKRCGGGYPSQKIPPLSNRGLSKKTPGENFMVSLGCSLLFSSGFARSALVSVVLLSDNGHLREIIKNSSETSLKPYKTFRKEAQTMNNQTKSKTEQSRKLPPAKTPEARENQLVAMAVDLAEKQLRDGTATSQVITHFLKMGSTKEKIEKEILEKQKELITAKTEALKSQKRIEDLYANALNAMRRYSGVSELDDEEDD